MKTKSIIAAFLLAASSAFAQVPSYVPTNGLVGWWPFNGNANDESGLGNNGIVSGSTLTSDRFGNANSAYLFDGVNDYIRITDNNNYSFGTGGFTYSFGLIVTPFLQVAQIHLPIYLVNRIFCLGQTQMGIYSEDIAQANSDL